jgi:hypothetical protein
MFSDVGYRLIDATEHGDGEGEGLGGLVERGGRGYIGDWACRVMTRLCPIYRVTPVPHRLCMKRSHGEKRLLSAMSPMTIIISIMPIT